ncbi:Telomerase reverse transcriptase [Vermiconidia calcicola]|uniref:Telomerase reverse transcriptase n=1 Tax=Vermiconidia calcicola TaxID=1690605 RepID=A0ACC3MP34_9PEZI|nr:Telomerase reverse transcriptase [Vermiconidia calcicola]
MKRKRKCHRESRVNKRQKVDDVAEDRPAWPLLRQHYPSVLTLRRYLASSSSNLSKRRRKKILRYGLEDKRGEDAEDDTSLVQLLDGTVVGTFERSEVKDCVSIEKDITIFTQQLSESPSTISPTQGALKQNEIVDFAIWQLFRRHNGSHAPSHMLARGYQKYASMSNNDAGLIAVPGVPGVFCNTANPYVRMLKEHPWCALPSLLGSAAERLMSDLLLNCGVFQSTENSSNLNQLSGAPLSDLKVLKNVAPVSHVDAARNEQDAALEIPKASSGDNRGLSDIRFVRHRMLYAKAAFSARGKVTSGLSRAHVLNRHHTVDDEKQTVHVMKYMFPRQFGLHNVFTSDIDPKDTAQPFKDYTLRDADIARSLHDWRQRRARSNEVDVAAFSPLSKRLRGPASQLVARLRKRHSRCSYTTLLHHYCPSPSISKSGGQGGSIAQASPTAQVSAFCRSVVSRVFPNDFWGIGESGLPNKKNLMQSIDKFVRLRRYESLTLHDVMQNVRIHDIEWLAPQHGEDGKKLSATDFAKRKELMAELVYYLFDSFLIPLIRGHFHVTESGAHRNQLFYFRHDVWKSLSEPALATLKESMLEECNTMRVQEGMARRALGVSQVRLLPKEQGMRPIINLRRRVQRLQHGRLVLGRSINSILTPAFSILNFERTAHPEMLGSAMLSVEDMYPRLQSFRRSLQDQGLFGKPLYFAKVDVRACFDTIPQKRLMKLARTVLGDDVYQITKYARTKLVGRHNQETPGFGARPSWRYLTKANTGNGDANFTAEAAADTAEGRTSTVYIDGVVRKSESRKAVLDLLEEHIESNLIKLGNRFYRQKQGIPQGSIVSSLLCSYFYAELERKVLQFVRGGESMLLRLIDDFLVISTEQHVAERFVREMHQGIPEFGVEVKAEKSRVNFDIEIGGKAINRLPAETDFPYCGHAINTVTLDLSKDKERRKKSSEPNPATPLQASLTFCRHPRLHER